MIGSARGRFDVKLAPRSVASRVRVPRHVVTPSEAVADWARIPIALGPRSGGDGQGPDGPDGPGGDAQDIP